MSACRSEKPMARSGFSARIRPVRALVNADTRGFSRARRRRPHREAGDADDPLLLAQRVQDLGRLLRQADDALRVHRYPRAGP